MKNYLHTLMVVTLSSTFFVAGSAIGGQMTHNQILSAIDGEYNHVEDDATKRERVNFDLSAQDSVASLNGVLSGIDGEYDAGSTDTSRVNFDLSSSDAGVSMHEVLSGIDGEYE